MTPVHDNEFQEMVIESRIPVLVVFERYGWGTAEIIRPVLEKLALVHNQELKVLKYNMDDCTTVAQHYQVEEKTTLLFFKDGELIVRTGVVPAIQIEEVIRILIAE